jgi:hypothetical protein
VRTAPATPFASEGGVCVDNAVGYRNQKGDADPNTLEGSQHYGCRKSHLTPQLLAMHSGRNDSAMKWQIKMLIPEPGVVCCR